MHLAHISVTVFFKMDEIRMFKTCICSKTSTSRLKLAPQLEFNIKSQYFFGTDWPNLNNMFAC